ncbi:hypothetical protein BV22DRAFT_1135039 [Leucogyrophana mollusca]|uniref:Uncharacterized protein n=1 Tax=Leucogyrophana mollusca TaxID=85980 RepID=A0ACB8AYD0_9AGAM|nr:hypothetical protein BV22DRAFT_1135039 [Leucogyrophana mollusca]
MNGASASPPPVTLYPGTSPATNPPQSHPGPGTNSPKNASSSVDAPQKRSNLPSHGPGSAPQPTSASTPSQTVATSTPSLRKLAIYHYASLLEPIRMILRQDDLS